MSFAIIYLCLGLDHLYLTLVLGCVWIYLPQLENVNTPQIRMTSLNLAAAVDLEI